MVGSGTSGLRFQVLGRWTMRVAFTSAFLAWAALIFYLSSLPDEYASRVGPYDSYAVSSLGGLRSIVAHLALFGTLASLIQASIWSWTSFSNVSLRFTCGAIILAVLYGVFDEFHQSFVVGRNMSTGDMLVNALGAAAAGAALRQLAISVNHSPASLFKLVRTKA